MENIIEERLREVVLDTETTGLNPLEGHRVIEIGCHELINKIPTGRTYHAYINPEREVPNEAFEVHGISTAFLKNKPKFREIVDEFLEFIKDSKLVIHNAGFDISFINYELRLLKKSSIDFSSVIDTLVIARNRFPKAPVNLDALCQRFNISLSSREKHGALIDAELLMKVYLALSEGAQSSLSFSQRTAASKVVGFKSQESFPRRDYSLSEEEKKLHMDLIKAKIPNTLWDFE